MTPKKKIRRARRGPLKDYIDTIAPAPEWLKRIQAEAKRKGLDKLTTAQINRIIAKIRHDLDIEQQPRKVTKAISESTEKFKTSRYEP